MDRKFYPGDVINYGLLSNLTIIAEIDDKYYLVKDSSGNTKKIYQSLINKYQDAWKRTRKDWRDGSPWGMSRKIKESNFRNNSN